MHAFYVPIAAFLAVAFGVFGSIFAMQDFVGRDRRRIKMRLASLEKAAEALEKMSVNPLMSMEQIPVDLLGATSPSIMEKLRLFLFQAGHSGSVTRFLVVSAMSAGLMGALVGFAVQWWPWGIIGGSIALFLPYLVYGIQRTSRQKQLRGQIIDAFELMGAHLSAGRSLSEAMQIIAGEFPAPISREFRICLDQQRDGLDARSALQLLAYRNDLIELKIFAVAVMVDTKIGGNLSRILRQLAKLVRDQLRMRDSLKAMVADGRLQGIVLIALVPMAAFLLFSFNREYVERLTHIPEVLMSVGALLGMAWLWTRSIAHSEE